MAALLLGALTQAGCSGTPSPSRSPTPNRPTASAALPDYRYLNPAVFPAQDTPLAQASAQLQQVWTPYDVTVIPSRHVLDGMPAPPTVINMTNGALSNADAQALAWAEYRQNAFIGWLEAAVQPGLNNHLREAGLFNGILGNTVRAGTSVNDPACDLYAAKIAVVPVDSSITAFESGKGYTVTSQYAMVVLYSGGCTVKTAAGQALFSDQSNTIAVETGAIRHDDVLGDVFYQESGRDCETTTQIAVCGVLQ